MLNDIKPLQKPYDIRDPKENLSRGGSPPRDQNHQSVYKTILRLRRPNYGSVYSTARLQGKRQRVPNYWIEPVNQKAFDCLLLLQVDISQCHLVWL